MGSRTNQGHGAGLAAPLPPSTSHQTLPTPSPAPPPVRPRISARSVSDLSPLQDPTVQQHLSKIARQHNDDLRERNSSLSQHKQHEQGQPSALGLMGTHLAVGGAKIVGGGQLPNGARAPISPFLPLPPAPTSSQLKMSPIEPSSSSPPRESQLAARRRRRMVKHSGSPSSAERSLPLFGRRASTNLRIDTQIPMGSDNLRRASATPAHPKPDRFELGAAADLDAIMPKSAGMIRSISMPVPTQREFEDQRRLMARAAAAANADGQNGASGLWWAWGWPAAGGGESPMSPPASISSSPVKVRSAASRQSPHTKPTSPSNRRGSRIPLGPLVSMPQESASPATEATTKSTRMDVDADVENISPLDVDDFTNDMANMDMASSPFYGPGLELPVQEDYFAMRHDPSSGSDEARTPIAVAPTMSSRLGTSMGKSISRASAIGTPSIMATGALGPHDFFIHPSHFEMPTAASS